MTIAINIKNNPFTILSKISLAVYYGIFFYLVFFYPNSLNVEATNQNNFIFFFLSVTSFLLNIVCNFFNKKSTLSQCLFFVLFSCSILFLDFTFCNEYYLVIISFLLISYSISLNPYVSYESLISMVFIAYFVQLLLGVYYLVSNVGESDLSIVGTFINSGMYSCFLCICLPAVHYILSKWMKKYSKSINLYKKNAIIFVYIFCVTATLIIFISNQSRTPLMILILFFLMKIKSVILPNNLNVSRFWKLTTFTLMLIVFVSVLMYLFYYKEMSSFGRLLIWKISLDASLDNFWLGIGLGKFSYQYPIWQANYFANLKTIPITEYLAAGETYYAFNEWIQLFTELGFIRFAILLFSLAVFFLTKSNKSVQSSVVKEVFFISCLTGLTAYSFHLNPILFIAFNIIIVWLIEYVHIKGYSIDSPYFRYGSIVIVVILCLKPTYLAASNISNINQLMDLENSIGKRGIERSFIDKRSEDLYSKSPGSVVFLQLYSELILNTNRSVPQVLKEYEKSTQVFISYSFLTTLAELYIIEKKYKNAGEIYLFLSNWIPSKYDCKIKLLRLYVKMGKVEEANALADLILKMPTKIGSYKVDLIKKESSVLKSKFKSLHKDSI